MARNSWKGRTTRFRELSSAEQEAYLNDRNQRISAKFGRWAYTELSLTDRARRAALVIIGSDESAPWTFSFLETELDLHWKDPLGGFVVSGIGRKLRWDERWIKRLEALYLNPDASVQTRGMCLHVLGWALLYCPAERREEFAFRLRNYCNDALWDEYPELRMGACVAGYLLGGFAERIHQLAEDESTDDLGNSVAERAAEWDL